MTEAELAQRLRAAVLAAGKGNKAVSIHLFGIDYAEHLKGHNLDNVLRLAGEEKTWRTEVRKGMKLSDYVVRR